MRLRMLAKLEHIKVEQELDEKRKEQKGLEKILGSRKVLEDLVVSEIETTSIPSATSGAPRSKKPRKPRSRPR